MRVALSTASVYPGTTYDAFRIASDLGYDAIEVMVGQDPVSQDPEQWKALSERFGVPVISVHAPVLIITQSVWGRDPWLKVRRTVAAAEHVGAETVVLHPPLRWQRDYAKGFEAGVREEQRNTSVTICVENMFPWGRIQNDRIKSGVPIDITGYRPSGDLRKLDVDNVVIDLSHTAASHDDPVQLARDIGNKLRHIHLADGTGQVRDEHLIPGRGTQPIPEFLSYLKSSGFDGALVIEVSTRSATSAQERNNDLAEALEYTRRQLRGES